MWGNDIIEQCLNYTLYLLIGITSDSYVNDVYAFENL